MSFDSMAATQPPVTVKRSSNPTQSDAAALANPGSFAAVATIRGRFVLSSSTQQTLWATQGIIADYELLTEQVTAVHNGDLLTYSDPNLGTRTFRVKGTQGQRMGQGSLNSFFKIPCKLVSLT